MIARAALRVLAVSCLVFTLGHGGTRAAEGGYSNYVPGTYGDFGMALAPTEKWTLRNDIYYYDVSTNLTGRSALSAKSTGKGENRLYISVLGGVRPHFFVFADSWHPLV